ncbi:MAG: VOC family protein [Planctomycetota bacterium]
MPPPLVCDHVAVLVTDLAQALDHLGPLRAHAGEVEDFPGEGTRECYVGGGGARLLLLEPIAEGPYRRALERRGPGLHHLAYVAQDPAHTLAALPGWFLHPHSLASQPRTLWACRPGLPLLELSQGQAPRGASFVTGVELACAPELVPHLAPLAASDCPLRPGPVTRLELEGSPWELPRS